MDEHSLHSPFFFDFYSSVIKAKPSLHPQAEQLRKKLLADERVITVTDLGTGKNKTPQRKISAIAENTLSKPVFSSLYKKIIGRYQHQSVIELGTSLGINTLYLASAQNTHVTTFEGCSEIANIATLTFEFAGAKNIKLIKGNIDITLPAYMQSIRKFDFALMDANHSYQATMKYFNFFTGKLHEKSVIVIDDIHTSSEMERAWNEIRNSKLVYGSMDLYRCGILFFDPSLNKQHVILQF